MPLTIQFQNSFRAVLWIFLIILLNVETTGSVHIYHRVYTGLGRGERQEWGVGAGSAKQIIDLWQHVCRHCQDKVAARVRCVWTGPG